MIALPAEITQPLSAVERDFTLAFTADGLPDADLAVTGFRLEEAISSLFQAEIALASPDPGLDLTALLGAELEAVPAGQAAGLPISGEHGLRDGGEAV